MKEMKEMKRREWIYPVSLKYRENWGEWEAIREIVQNMLDTYAEFKITKKENGLLLRDYGTGLKRKHLILGVSEKGENARGKFGEGLKFAILVLKRLGYNVTVKSKNLTITVDVENIEGEKCLKLYLDERDNGIETGTEIFIDGYTGDTYENNFVRNNKRKLYSCYKGEIISEMTNRLYVKDIYVCDLKNARYSYNLSSITLSEDRNIPSEYSLHTALGILYSKINKTDILKNLFEAINEEKYEQKIDMSYITILYPEKWVEAFKEYYGDNAVLGTDENWSREAEWRNAKVVTLPKDISFALESVIETDKSFVIKDNDKEIIQIDDDELTEIELKHLNILRELSKIASECVTVKVTLMDSPAKFNTVTHEIFIDRKAISNLEDSLGHLVHELAHEYGALDMTEQMIRQMGNVAGKLLYPFVKPKEDEDETSSLSHLF